MSDEPKKRSLAWVWWTTLALLVLYPLSMGPVLKIGLIAGTNLSGLYAPIFDLMDASGLVFDVVQWYCGLWQVIVNGI